MDKKEIKDTDYQELSIDNSLYNVSTNEFFTSTLDLYYKIRDEYTISPIYGLDNFLNMNIRHGGLVNLLWGPVKNHKLAYLKNDKGHYEKEKYWFEQYMYLTSANVEVMDQTFKKFSKNVDKAIQKAKGWIHINTGEFSSDDKAFNFFTDVEFVEGLIAKTTPELGFDKFLNLAIDDLNSQTDIALEKIRDIINTQLRADFDKCFTELLSDIGKIHRLEELTRKIKLAQREVNEKISELMSWMAWKGETKQNFLLGSALDAAQEMAQNLHPGFVVEVINADESRGLINGEYFRRFVTAFLILFDNAVIHSGINLKLCIEVSFKSIDDDKVCIKVSNPISHQSLINNKEKIIERNRNINVNYVTGANEESGSGLYKVKKLLTYDIEVENIIVLNICEQENVYSVSIILDKDCLNDSKNSDS